MAQETVVLVTNVSDKYLTAEDAINNNFDEVYAGITSGAPLNQSSGVLTGGVLSIGTGGAGVATTFSITAGTGQIVDNTVNPTTVTAVSWTAQINVAVTNILTNLVTFVAIDSGGNVIQSTTDFTPVQMREYIVIGVVVHSNQTTVNAINQAQIVAYNQGNQLTDLMYSIGLFNVSGNIFSANGANLKINKSAGSIFRRGANYTTLTDNPHLVTTGALTQAPLRMQNQTGAGSASTTDIDVANYDLAGVTTAISPATRFSVLRIYLFQSNLIAVQRGQATYLSLAEAKASIQTETFVTNSILAANGLLRGFLCVRANATDLSNPTQAFFIDAGKFGSSSGVGGLSVSTLQNAYDNSSTPEILTDSTRGAISVKRGSAADTDAVIEVLNGAGSTVATITGEGNVTVTDEAYGVSWDGSTEVPTKNALYDKIETLGGASAFTDLSDVPASYVGQALKTVRVNAGETALEFSTAGAGDVTKVGTPVNNQVGVWTGDGTIEGDAALTFDTTTDTLTSGTFNGTALTASELLGTDASKNIVSLPVATYPSQAELAYVKGVTSAIQTQLNAKPDDFLELSDTPNSYAGEGLKLVRVNATPNALEFVTANSTLVGLGNVVNADTTTMANITGTKAQFDTAVTDGNILFVGDITQYTDELAQDAVGAMVDTTLVYNDLAPSLSRAALTGAITASAGSNATLLGSFTTAQLNTALSDNDIATGGGTATGTNTGDQTSVSGNAGTATTLQTAREINGVSFNGSADIVVDQVISIFSGLGGTIKATTPTGVAASGSGVNFADQTVRFNAIYLPKDATLTGVCWCQVTQGNYTANNYNGVGLYSYAAGTLTLVASSTNDGNIWKGTANTFQTKAFSSTYAAQAGLYFIGLLYCRSAQTTAPSILGNTATVAQAMTLDFTNSAKLHGTLAAQTALPSPQASSGITAVAGWTWLGLY